MKRTLISTLLVLGAATAIAAPANSNIPLTGGSIAPKGTLSISLNQLVQNINYNVTCTINDPNNASNPVISAISAILGQGNQQLGNIYFNGKQVGMGTAQAQLPGVNTTVLMNGVITSQPSAGDIYIQNADTTDAISVSNCVAIAIGAKK